MIALILRLFGFNILKGFFKNPKKILITILIVSLLSGMSFFIWKYNHMKNEIISLNQHNFLLKERVDEYIDNERILHSKINKQNASIENYKKEGQRAKERLSQANKKVQDITNQYDKEINNIFISKTPKTCGESLKYLMESPKDNLKW